MDFPIKSKDHKYLLVKYEENCNTFYRIAKASDIVSCSKFSLDQRLHFQFDEDMATVCTVIITSDDVHYLNEELDNIVQDNEIPLYYSETLDVRDLDQFQACNDLNKSMHEESGEPLRNCLERQLTNLDVCLNNSMAITESGLSDSLNDLKTFMSGLKEIDEYPGKMFTFGPNRTEIPEYHVKRSLWNCYKLATRTLFTIVFADENLGPQSLTERSETLRMLQFDQKRLQDIIYIVIEKCNVRKRDVMKVISNLYRFHLARLKRRLENASKMKNA